MSEINNREKAKILSYHINRIIPDLRMVNLSDYVKYITENKNANIDDIINSATELYFSPTSFKYKNASCDLDNDNYPNINFNIVFNNMGVKVNFTLTLARSSFMVKINQVSFPNDVVFKNMQNEKLHQALLDASLIKFRN